MRYALPELWVDRGYAATLAGDAQEGRVSFAQAVALITAELKRRKPPAGVPHVNTWNQGNRYVTTYSDHLPLGYAYYALGEEGLALGHLRKAAADFLRIGDMPNYRRALVNLLEITTRRSFANG